MNSDLRIEQSLPVWAARGHWDQNGVPHPPREGLAKHDARLFTGPGSWRGSRAKDEVTWWGRPQAGPAPHSPASVGNLPHQGQPLP